MLEATFFDDFRDASGTCQPPPPISQALNTWKVVMGNLQNWMLRREEEVCVIVSTAGGLLAVDFPLNIIPEPFWGKTVCTS